MAADDPEAQNNIGVKIGIVTSLSTTNHGREFGDKVEKCTTAFETKFLQLRSDLNTALVHAQHRYGVLLFLNHKDALDRLHRIYRQYMLGQLTMDQVRSSVVQHDEAQKLCKAHPDDEFPYSQESETTTSVRAPRSLRTPGQIERPKSSQEHSPSSRENYEAWLHQMAAVVVTCRKNAGGKKKQSGKGFLLSNAMKDMV
ncbi:hypothetical protein H2200_001024 [Cladophialophora chaetospira]|uniref:Uncharacterized protein n=1 Tax=Cladophialophora chaetospira TaxID=386627 RepID=A0AA39CRJ8_9EURO|nr:hypothetical protein H2200_001024 [Cladophialophora chaetospira]